MAIQAIEQSMTDVDMKYVEVETKPNGDMSQNQIVNNFVNISVDTH